MFLISDKCTLLLFNANVWSDIEELYVEIFVELYVCKYTTGSFNFIFLELFENQRDPLFS
jgi:hypothetical protein